MAVVVSLFLVGMAGMGSAIVVLQRNRPVFAILTVSKVTVAFLTQSVVIERLTESAVFRFAEMPYFPEVSAIPPVAVSQMVSPLLESVSFACDIVLTTEKMVGLVTAGRISCLLHARKTSPAAAMDNNGISFFITNIFDYTMFRIN